MGVLCILFNVWAGILRPFYKKLAFAATTWPTTLALVIAHDYMGFDTPKLCKYDLFPRVNSNIRCRQVLISFLSRKSYLVMFLCVPNVKKVRMRISVMTVLEFYSDAGDIH